MNRPEKLIQVGLSYDLAHAKGEIRETEKEKAAHEIREQKKKAADHQKRRAELRADMLKDWDTGKKRLARSKRQAKRKEDYFRKKAEAAKATGTAQTEKDNEAPASEDKEAKATTAEASNFGGGEVEGTKVEGEEVEGQTTQAVSDAEVEAAEASTSAPLSPSPETLIDGEDDANEEEGGNVKEEMAEVVPVDTAEEEGGVPPTDAAEEAVAEGEGDEAEAEQDDDDWEYASDASFQSSIVTELDLPPLSDVAPYAASAEDNEADEANAEFEDDPWNAVCVVGLKVYSKDKGLCVETIRPKHELEEGDTPLDVDDASKGQSVDKIEKPKEE
ncbi:MAG: hypothetical protein Q9166_000078 [cf. Caloplaca sp. 2 TL-2023]